LSGVEAGPHAGPSQRFSFALALPPRALLAAGLALLRAEVEAVLAAERLGAVAPLPVPDAFAPRPAPPDLALVEDFAAADLAPLAPAPALLPAPFAALDPAPVDLPLADFPAGDFGAADLGAEDLGAEDLGAEDLAAEDLAADDLASDDLAPDDLAPDDFAPDDFAPDPVPLAFFAPADRAPVADPPPAAARAPIPDCPPVVDRGSLARDDEPEAPALAPPPREAVFAPPDADFAVDRPVAAEPRLAVPAALLDEPLALSAGLLLALLLAPPLALLPAPLAAPLFGPAAESSVSRAAPLWRPPVFV
jgi:hypothetical protein